MKWRIFINKISFLLSIYESYNIIEANIISNGWSLLWTCWFYCCLIFFRPGISSGVARPEEYYNLRYVLGFTFEVFPILHLIFFSFIFHDCTANLKVCFYWLCFWSIFLGNQWSLTAVCSLNHIFEGILLVILSITFYGPAIFSGN